MRQITKTIEVRKIKHSASLSEETYAYTAEVWVDGKKFCIVSNHGTGGPDDHHPVAPFTWKDVDALDEWMKANLPKQDCSDLYGDGEKHELDTDLEIYCHDAVTAHLVSKDVARQLKTKMLWVEDGKLWQVAIPKKMTDEQRAKWLCLMRQKYCKVTFLNDMPFDAAVAAYKAVR